jgi:hypothetical protein
MSEEVAATGTERVDTASPPARSLARERARLRMVERVLFGLCGSLLLVGFFLPWFVAGAMVSMSGLALVFASGEMVGMIAGANRLLLVVVPLLGAILLGGAIVGHRVTRWLAVGGAGVILLFGFIILVRFFVSSTGLGMWLVVVAALLSLSIGLVSIGRVSRTSGATK